MSCFVIAEAGVNHNGRISRCLDFIIQAKDAGANAVKFQLFRDRPEIERLRLYEGDLAMLCNVCRDNDIEFMCTPFYLEAITFLDPLVKRHKVASGWLDNEEFMEAIWATKKPVIISTGKNSTNDLLRTPFHYPSTSLLHCVSQYPCPDEQANLKRITELKTAFDNLPIGYSDHTVGITACVAAAALGAEIIEKHLTFDKTAPGPDHSCSAEPEEFAEMVRQIRRVESML